MHPQLNPDPETHRIAHYITEFSLAGIRSFAKSKSPSSSISKRLAVRP
jgi:hypothetical protein